MNFYRLMWLSNADTKVFHTVIWVIQIWPASCPSKSQYFLFVTADKRLWISHKILAISVPVAPSNKSSCTPENSKKTTLGSAHWSHPWLLFLRNYIYTSFSLMDFIAFTVHSLNDRTQTVNWISPGATLSGFSRYTQQHLFLCPWKWDCLWARECLCITFFPCVYSMENDDSKISNKNYYKLILVTFPARTNCTNRKFHWLWTWKHLSTDSSQVYVFRRQREKWLFARLWLFYV